MFENNPTEAPQVSTVVQVPVNIFTGTLQRILSFTSTQVRVLVDYGYYSQEYVLYWRFTDIKEWFQIKPNITARHSGVFYGGRKIK